jgi:hypothetical protein
MTDLFPHTRMPLCIIVIHRLPSLRRGTLPLQHRQRTGKRLPSIAARLASPTPCF